MDTLPVGQLATFPNPAPTRDYTIRIRIPEFTCLCPKTGQPDFAVLHLEYIPNHCCLELKALKQYIWSFRDTGAFHEAVTNRILDELVVATKPRFMRLTAEFNVRGGLYTTVIAEYGDVGTPLAPVGGVGTSLAPVGDMGTPLAPVGDVGTPLAPVNGYQENVALSLSKAM